MYTRSDYMKKVVSHDEYYGQFVDDSVINYVRTCIGKKQIESSSCQHFNDIPLRWWDSLVLPSHVLRQVITANDSGGYSLSDTVCIAKAAARQIRGW